MDWTLGTTAVTPGPWSAIVENITHIKPKWRWWDRADASQRLLQQVQKV